MKTQKEIENLLPNYAGISCHTPETEKLRKAHN